MRMIIWIELVQVWIWLGMVMSLLEADEWEKQLVWLRIY